MGYLVSLHRDYYCIVTDIFIPSTTTELKFTLTEATFVIVVLSIVCATIVAITATIFVIIHLRKCNEVEELKSVINKHYEVQTSANTVIKVVFMEMRP